MGVGQMSRLKQKKRNDFFQNTEKERDVVRTIISEVHEFGDEAVRKFTKQFDGSKINQFLVAKEEIKEAYKEITPEIIEILKEAKQNIYEFHEKQKLPNWSYERPDGTYLAQIRTSIDSVALYIPGGKAAYPSTVLMNAIPAQIAGVERIIIVTPPNKEGKIASSVLVAADMMGITEIYKIGGAQAIAACAFGTDTIEAVNKIVGPGNIYVALAKRELYGVVDIDMIAGPSEIAIIADEYANPKYIAADLLSQAEHDERAVCICYTTSEQLANNIRKEIEIQLRTLPKKDIAESSINNYGEIIVVPSLEEAFRLSNELAPEHLEVQVKDAKSWLPFIKHAGSIFLGEYSSEPIGDYFAGPNHTLPTSGTAKFFSPLSVEHFMKRSSVLSYSKEAFDNNYRKIASFARLEGLEAHARAIEVRGEQPK